MNRYTNPNATNSTSKSSKYQSPANFIEALKSAGGTVVKDVSKGLKQDLFQGSLQQMSDTIFDRDTMHADQKTPDQEKFDFEEFMRSNDKKRAHDRVKSEYEQSETVILNRRQEETKRKIAEIQEELKKLAREIVHLDASTNAAIQQEIVSPGQYHINFFESLLMMIKQLRKRVSESRNWAALSKQRGKSKSYFWNQSDKKIGGTAYMLSQERQVATQTG